MSFNNCPVKSCNKRYGFEGCDDYKSKKKAFEKCRKLKRLRRSCDKNELPPLNGRVTDNMLKFIFGDMATWAITKLKRKDGKKICYWCKKPAVTYALVNYVGNVHKIPACAGHRKKRHGVCTEGDL